MMMMMIEVMMVMMLLWEVDISHKNALSLVASVLWCDLIMFVWTARGPEVSCLHYLNCGIAQTMNVFHDMQPT